MVNQSWKLYTLAIFIFTISVSSLVSILIFINPFDAPVVILFLFYFTLLLSVLATSYLVLLFLRSHFTKTPLELNHKNSYRQAWIIGFTFCTAAFLSSFDLLNWWSTACLILFATFVELFINAN